MNISNKRIQLVSTPINEIIDNYIRITGDVKYYNNCGVTYINSAFSIKKKSKKYINAKYFYKYFIDIKKNRKFKIEKINESTR